ncbi:MAG: hypothetical protein AAF004_03425 [Pseudomonadota bacterium]
MKNKTVDRWLTPATNLAVLVGILLILVELKQNQEVLELEQTLALLESQQADFEAFREQRNQVIEDPELAQLVLDGASGKELSAVDAFRFLQSCQNWIWTGVLMHDRSSRLGREGYPEATVQWFRSAIEQPGLKNCWQSTKSIYALWGFEDFVLAVDGEAR